MGRPSHGRYAAHVPVYLDHAADAPIHPAALDAMTTWLDRGGGNPSGGHQVARRARKVVDENRDRLAAFLGCDPGGVVFTSGGTEADNLAVLGGLAGRPGAVVTSAVEHPAVTEAARASGREVRVVSVGADGVVDLEQMERLVDREVALVSIQLVNHETGVVQPLDPIGRRVRRRAPAALFHTDAVQGAGWLDIPSATAAADLVSISGHKIGGPQGIGALAVRKNVTVSPILHGGGQERQRRSGTHNVAGIVGLGAAVGELDGATRRASSEAVGELRDLLARLVVGSVPWAVRTAGASERAPGHCHLRFPGLESEALLFLLDQAGVCASAGAACASGAIEASPVLLAMGVDKVEAGSSIRFTLGPGTTREEVEEAAAAVSAAVAALGDG